MLAQQTIHKRELLLSSVKKLAPKHRAEFRQRSLFMEQQHRVLPQKSRMTHQDEKAVLQEKDANF